MSYNVLLRPADNSGDYRSGSGLKSSVKAGFISLITQNEIN